MSDLDDLVTNLQHCCYLLPLQSTKRNIIMAQSSVLCAFARYQGEFTPANLVFNSNLQEFAQKVSYIVALETGGKLSAVDAYEQIESLREDLKKSKQQLGIANAEYN
jgi:hypothetical protein